MKIKCFTIYDRVLDDHTTLFTAQNEGMAVRQINSMRKNPGHPLNEYPEEMDLYEVGSFDSGSALLEPKVARKIGSLKSLEIKRGDQEAQISSIHG